MRRTVHKQERQQAGFPFALGNLGKLTAVTLITTTKWASLVPALAAILTRSTSSRDVVQKTHIVMALSRKSWWLGENRALRHSAICFGAPVPAHVGVLTTGCDTVRCDSECAHALRAARALSGVNPGKPHTPREGPPHHTYTRAPLLANTTAHIGPPVCEGGLNALISHEKATESDYCGNRKYNVAAIVVLLNEVIDDLLA